MSSGEGLGMYGYVNKPAYVAALSIFCGLSILTNLFMMTIIIVSRNLRTSPKHIAIFILCLVDFYDTVSGTALIIDLFIRERWQFDPRYREVINQPQYFVFSTFRISLLITICVIVVSSMMTRKKAFLVLLSVSMIIASFIYSLVLVLPATEQPKLSFMDECSLILGSKISLASFFPQVIVLVVLIVNICILSCCPSKFLDDVTSPGSSRFPVDAFVGSLVMIVLTVPYKVVDSFFSSCSNKDECRNMYISVAVTGLLEIARYFLLPLTWLLCHEVRRGIRSICCCRKNPEPQHVYKVPAVEEAKM